VLTYRGIYPLRCGSYLTVTLHSMIVGALPYGRKADPRATELTLGIDINADCVERHRKAGRNVALGDATDADFWALAERSGKVKLALLVFLDHSSNLAVARLLHEQGLELELASVAYCPDHEEGLREAGVQKGLSFYAGAGENFAEHVVEDLAELIDKKAAGTA